MPISCPCCKAANDVGPACRRCRADLSLLFAIEGRRAFLVAEARRLMNECKFPEALRFLDDAEALRGGADVSRLRAAAHLLNRDFAAAWAAYHESA